MNIDSDHAVSHSRLADDAMQRDFPENFPSREAWDEYNDRLDREERSAEHRALHGSEVKYPETVVLRAKDGCTDCGGKGYVTESHGEDLDCDCCFENATPDQIESVEMGAFIVRPSKSYETMMHDRIVESYKTMMEGMPSKSYEQMGRGTTLHEFLLSKGYEQIGDN